MRLKVFPIGCSGASLSRLIVLRDAIPSGANNDAEETLYLVAGEATLTLGGKEQPITPGWFTIVPRGTSYALGTERKKSGDPPVHRVRQSMRRGQHLAPVSKT